MAPRVSIGSDANGFAPRLSKKDKRTHRRNALLAKASEARVSKPKQRRPTKKIQTNLTDLEEALNDINDVNGGNQDDEWEGLSEEDFHGDRRTQLSSRPVTKRSRVGPHRAVKSSVTMSMRSLKHRPGMLKRKKVMEGLETNRFQRNMAQMVASIPQKENVDMLPSAKDPREMPTLTHRWASLRGFIRTTLDRDEAFAKR